MNVFNRLSFLILDHKHMIMGVGMMPEKIISLHSYISVYVYVCVYVCMYTCVCMCVYMCVWVCVFVCVRAYACALS